MLPSPQIAPKFLYDALGSKLFEAITELDEYYPTRTEAAIFERHLDALAQACGFGHTLVDLGAGNCAKAERLFGALRPSRYVAVDIASDFLLGALSELQSRHPQLPMWGLGLDFTSALELPAQVGHGTRLMFYPGSSIGNFTPEAAAAFLGRVRAAAPGGALLIGVDLVKPAARLEAAYDDALGVTAAFNLNLLRHVNRLLGSDFDVRQWRHVALYDAGQARIEMHLEARCDLQVRWPGGTLSRRTGERVHTENSYKYSVEGFDRLLRRAGYTDARCWTDPQGEFALFVAH
jgi:dimethylhistidine N-methyltransferase